MKRSQRALAPVCGRCVYASATVCRDTGSYVCVSQELELERARAHEEQCRKNAEVSCAELLRQTLAMARALEGFAHVFFLLTRVARVSRLARGRANRCVVDGRRTEDGADKQNSRE